jgi:hypothetical protein
LAINKPWSTGDDIHPVQDLQLLSKFASSPTYAALLQGVTQHKTGRMGFKAMEYMECLPIIQKVVITNNT